MMEPAISVQNLCVQYRRKDGKPITAVQDLSFEVMPGEVVGFLGPNGAGKSSTLKVLMGFVQSFAGQAHVLGQIAGSEGARANIGYLPEVAMYYPYLTPLETLNMYGELQGMSGVSLRKAAKECLVQVGLGHAMTRLNRSLSKGMLQRVGIAQALLGDPSVLILDEVTSGLDPVGRKELRELLLSRKKSGATLFFSSHELAEVEMLCDRILVIHQGRLVDQRNLPELQSELRRYELVFGGAADLSDLADQISPTVQRTTLARFASKENMIQALSRIQQSGDTVFDVIAQEGSLEDYFIDVIGRAA